MLPDEHEQFRELLLTVTGQAYQAAGLMPEDSPMRAAAGLFEFVSPDASMRVAYQLLIYRDSAYSAGQPNRFSIRLMRGGSTGREVRELAELVARDYGLNLLPQSPYWWSYRTPDELAQALAHSGRMVLGFGLPWLRRDPLPSNSSG